MNREKNVFRNDRIIYAIHLHMHMRNKRKSILCGVLSSSRGPKVLDLIFFGVTGDMDLFSS